MDAFDESLYIVSIHAPREGCDSDSLVARRSSQKFQFTHPGRGATVGGRYMDIVTRVSIHAPREGCDTSR